MNERAIPPEEEKILLRLLELGVTPERAAAAMRRLQDGRREHNDFICDQHGLGLA